MSSSLDDSEHIEQTLKDIHKKAHERRTSFRRDVCMDDIVIADIHFWGEEHVSFLAVAFI